MVTTTTDGLSLRIVCSCKRTSQQRNMSTAMVSDLFIAARTSKGSTLSGKLVTAPVLVRHTSSALSLASNGTSNHIGGENNTNNTRLSSFVFGDRNGNGNNNNNNNNGITPTDAHRRNSSANSPGVGMVPVHGYATSGSISFGGPSSAIIQNGVSHIQSQRSNRMLPLVMMIALDICVVIVHLVLVINQKQQQV